MTGRKPDCFGENGNGVCKKLSEMLGFSKLIFRQRFCWYKRLVLIKKYSKNCSFLQGYPTVWNRVRFLLQRFRCCRCPMHRCRFWIDQSATFPVRKPTNHRRRFKSRCWANSWAKYCVGKRRNWCKEDGNDRQAPVPTVSTGVVDKIWIWTSLTLLPVSKIC